MKIETALLAGRPKLRVSPDEGVVGTGEAYETPTAIEARQAHIAGGRMPGSYINLTFPWYETRILNCMFCGKMIAGQYWQDDSFPADKFCEPSCADVKRRLRPATHRSNRHSHKEKHS
jgi:hypothetical protein